MGNSSRSYRRQGPTSRSLHLAKQCSGCTCPRGPQELGCPRADRRCCSESRHPKDGRTPPESRTVAPRENGCVGAGSRKTSIGREMRGGSTEMARLGTFNRRWRLAWRHDGVASEEGTGQRCGAIGPTVAAADDRIGEATLTPFLPSGVQAGIRGRSSSPRRRWQRQRSAR